VRQVIVHTSQLFDERHEDKTNESIADTVFHNERNLFDQEDGNQSHAGQSD